MKKSIHERNPQFPQCGFSMRTAEALKACNIQYEHVDVYAEPGVRENLQSSPTGLPSLNYS